MTPTKEPKSRFAAAAELLQKEGYTWFPGVAEWKRTPGLPLSEVHLVDGWYRCAQVKPGARQENSWDGYTLVTKTGLVHFNLDLRERKWAPSIGYEDRVCFVPINIVEELRMKSG